MFVIYIFFEIIASAALTKDHMNLAQSVCLSVPLIVCPSLYPFISTFVCSSVCYTLILKIGSLIFSDFLNEVRFQIKVTKLILWENKLHFCVQNQYFFYFSQNLFIIYFLADDRLLNVVKWLFGELKESCYKG